jgi:DNA-binding response OmpR family regulator
MCASESQSLLLIDDQPGNLHMLILYLEDYQFNVFTALNGEDGLKLAHKHHPALILLDISMPKMDGFNVCAKLKSNPATVDIPVIFFSAMDAVEEKLKAFGLGAADYITKPVLQQELLARITLHLNQKRLQHNLLQRLNAYQEHYGPLPGECEQGSEVSARHLKQVRHARELLLQNLCTPPSLDALSQAVGLGRKKLLKDFQVLYGMPVFEWLREHRLQHARTLLNDKSLSIEHIAESVGYSNSANFSNAFKQRFHMTPRAYRRLRENMP